MTCPWKWEQGSTGKVRLDEDDDSDGEEEEEEEATEEKPPGKNLNEILQPKNTQKSNQNGKKT